MKQWARCLICILLLVAVASLSACSLFSGGTLDSEAPAPASEADATAPAEVTKEEDERIRNLINDFFSSLFSKTPIEYMQYSASGTIPAWIKDFISKETLELENGNPEIGIHMPRFIEINGLTVLDYKPVKYKKENGTEIPDIEAGFIGLNDGRARYFVKVVLYGRCLKSGDFKNYFVLNPNRGGYEKKVGAEISENNVDYIRVRVKYDVEVRKDEGNYKIVSAREVNAPQDFASRMLLFNNDSIERLSYINIEKGSDGKTYINEQDGKVYEEEKSLIRKYFESLAKNLDGNRMKLMSHYWNKSSKEFTAYLDKISGGSEDESLKLTNLMSIKEDYKNKFDILSMPLQLNMENIKDEFKSFEVIPHPGYTKQQKRYLVTFVADVKRTNGTIDNEYESYRYDYYVTLQKEGGQLKVTSAVLNSCSKVTAKSQKEGEKI